MKGLLFNNNPVSDNHNGETLDTSPEEDDSENSLTSSFAKERFIILETNYKIYAYTDNPLHLSILKYFSEYKTTLPGFHCFLITRMSIQKACEQGITPELIITYLKEHAHEKQVNMSMSLGGSGAKHVLPPVVTDSVRLWGLERERIKDLGNVRMYTFRSDEDFQLINTTVEKLNAKVWANQTDKQIIMKDDKKIIKEVKKTYKGRNK